MSYGGTSATTSTSRGITGQQRSSARRVDPGPDPGPTKGWFRRVLPIVLAHRVIVLASVVSSLVMVVAMVLFPLWMGFALNEALAAPMGRREPLGFYLWVLLAITMVGVAAGFVSRYLSMRVAYALEFDLRTLLYRHLAWLPLSFYDRTRPGQLISRANSDVRALQMFLAFGPMVVVQFGMLFLALYFMLRIDVLLTLLSITVLPVVFQIGMAMRKHMFPVSWLVQSRVADIATIVDENVNGAGVVKAFAAERLQIGLLARAAEGLRWASVLLVRIRARFGPIMENVVRVGEALVLLYGGFLVIDGSIGPGDILVFLTFLVMLQAPFRMLGMIMMMAQRAAASAHRIYEVLDEVPEIADRPGALDLTDCRGEVEWRDVHFGFADGPRVLRGFDLRVPAGQTVALVGATGSGKTSAAQLIPRLYDVDSGAMLVDGHDVRDLTLSSLRRHVGVCFEEPFLFSASIRDNIAYGMPDARHADVLAAAAVAGAHQFVTSLEDGYDTVVAERGSTLSGGQRQRIAIARAVLANPRILILDDATSAIDVRTEQRIHDALRQLVRERTTIIIAHRLSTITLADRVVLVADGRVVASGDHRELLASEPRYAEALAHLSEEDQAKAARVARPHVEEPELDVSDLAPLDPDHLYEEGMR